MLVNSEPTIVFCLSLIFDGSGLKRSRFSLVVFGENKVINLEQGVLERKNSAMFRH